LLVMMLSAVSVFYFVLCNDLILYGEEIGLFPKNSKQKYKFHREIFLSDLRIILISSDSKSFVMIGPDKGTVPPPPPPSSGLS
jgi:hypothetical protein